ncbi:hypothetical protein HanPI659440_Chr02g0083111 [Helianthus annuus]|nr:hypothetical protein HanPI659440_Chr02g0083111 [Helianthus annuus]
MAYGSSETISYDVALGLSWSLKMTYDTSETITYDVVLDLAG